MLFKNKFFQLIDIYFFYLIILFPIIFLFRSFIINFVLLQISILFLLISKVKKYNFMKYKYNQILFVFFTLYFARQIYDAFYLNQLDIVRLLKSLFLLKFFFLFNSIIFLFNKKNFNNIKKNFKLLNWFVFILIADIVFQYIFNFNLFGFEPGFCSENTTNCKRFSGMFGTELIAGGYLSTVGISILIFSSFFLKNKIVYFSFFFILITIFLTGERSAFLLTVFLLTTYFFFNFNIKSIKLPYIIITIFSFILLLNFIIKDTTKQRYYSDIHNLLFKYETNIFENFKSTPWGLHYSASYLMIKDNPILGGGFKSFRENCDKYEYINNKENDQFIVCSTHPHQFNLEILVDIGFIGYFLFFIFLIYLIKEYFVLKDLKMNNTDYTLLLFIFIFIFLPRPTGSLISTYFGSMFWYFLGIIVSYKKLFIYGLISKSKK